ncbi:MAG TPA: sugar ABC transporter permease [Candidatus Copromonas faecavium]|uniref:Sugar ABC transporter permease n=1 Tax=Candidatus Copromonas faecavium (nom. illeg.) TaxID=2840740 RepID=A0A9D1A3A2_9FIRM|nr:sugar ABC transporter permease [Candidatus Copromonas faecavium]
MKLHKKTRFFPYAMLLPTIVIFAVFMIYPILYSFYLSFTEFTGGTYNFVGLQNYIELFHDPVFYKALFNTFFYLIIQVPVMISLALLLAVLIEQKFIRGKGFFRMATFLPTITSLVAYSLVFKVLFNTNYGLINYVVELFGGEKIQWIYSAWPARASIIISITWRWVGYNMIILLAGIQAIPTEMYESASLDGANFWQQLFYITIPAIKPIILFTTITSTIGTLQLFDEPYILTQGGPNYATITLGEYLYDNGFTYLKFGFASALGYVMVIIIGLLSWLQFRVNKEE